MLIRSPWIGQCPRPRRLVRAAAIIVLVAAVPGARGGENELAGAARARQAVECGLPFLEREGVAWMEQKKCASCHHVPFLIWGHTAARAAGVTVDVKKLAEWTDWTWKFSRTRRAFFVLSATSPTTSPAAGDLTPMPRDLAARLQPIFDKPFATETEFVAELGRLLTRRELDQHQAALVKRATRPRDYTNDGGGLDTLSQLLLGRPRNLPDKKTATAFASDLQDLMLRWQQPDGSWTAAGQLPLLKRSHDETNACTTRWALVALTTDDHPSAPAQRAVERASAYLETAKPGQTIEAIVTELLVERSRRGQSKAVDELLAGLKRRQNDDGGWAFHPGGQSDAFATGQSLFVLGRCKVPSDDSIVRRAREYLIRSQTADGSWSVPPGGISSTTNEGRLKRLEPIYRYWGSGWAVIGLSGTLSEP